MEKRAPRFHGPNTWMIAREDYLGGEPAKSVCARYGIGIHAFNRRMKVEGWSRRKLAKANDLPPPLRRAAPRPAPGGDRVDGLPPAAATAPVEAVQLMQRALTAAALALSEGRAGDARALSQMAESLSRTATRAPKTSLETILRALSDESFQAELFRIDPDNPSDPDLPIKTAYWSREHDDTAFQEIVDLIAKARAGAGGEEGEAAPST